MWVTVTKRLEWDAAHRVLRHESQCSSLHGHRYAAEITCGANQLDSVGRVVDFGVIKGVVGEWIAKWWDHTTLVNSADSHLLDWCDYEHKQFDKRPPYLFRGEPTAENIAIELLNTAAVLLKDTGVKVVKVVIYETPTSRAEVAMV